MRGLCRVARSLASMTNAAWSSSRLFFYFRYAGFQPRWKLKVGERNIIFHLIERDGFLFTLQLRDFIIITFHPRRGRFSDGEDANFRTLMLIMRPRPSRRKKSYSKDFSFRSPLLMDAMREFYHRALELLIIWQRRNMSSSLMDTLKLFKWFSLCLLFLIHLLPLSIVSVLALCIYPPLPTPT